MKLLPVLLALGLAASIRPATALTFNFTQVAGDTLNAGQLSAFTTAGSAWSALLTDEVAVNIEVGFRSLGGNILGGASPNGRFVAYATLQQRLAADARSAGDGLAVAHLPAANLLGNANVVVTNAQARALGIATGGGLDGKIEFSSDFTFAETRNQDGSTPAGKHDLIGVALHEIGHVLGFLSDADGTLPRTVLDLFRYAPGTTSLSFANGTDAAFSIDGGATDIASFSNGVNAQASHWAPGSVGGSQRLLMDPALPTGATQNIQPVDLLALDVIGWDVAEVAVPAPSGLLAVAGGVVALAGRRRRVSRPA